jgi:hypothetical protein
MDGLEFLNVRFANEVRFIVQKAVHEVKPWREETTCLIEEAHFSEETVAREDLLILDLGNEHC